MIFYKTAKKAKVYRLDDEKTFGCLECELIFTVYHRWHAKSLLCPVCQHSVKDMAAEGVEPNKAMTPKWKKKNTEMKNSRRHTNL